MKHGWATAALLLALAFAHHVRLCNPFTFPLLSAGYLDHIGSATPHQAACARRSARWAVHAATSSDEVASQEEVRQSKKAAREKLLAQRVSASYFIFTLHDLG